MLMIPNKIKEELKNKCNVKANEVITEIEKLEKTNKFMTGILDLVTIFFLYKFFIATDYKSCGICMALSFAITFITTFLEMKFSNDLYNDYLKGAEKDDDE